MSTSAQYVSHFSGWMLGFLRSHAALLMTQNVIFSIAAGYTGRKSMLRYFLVSAIFFLTVCHFQRLRETPVNHGLLGLVVAGGSYMVMANCVDKLVLRGWDFETYGRLASKTRNDKATQLDRRRMASEIVEQPRGVGTFWEIRNVPLFREDKDQDFVPERWTYVLSRLLRIPTAFFCHRALLHGYFWLAYHVEASPPFVHYAVLKLLISWCTALVYYAVFQLVFDCRGLLTAMFQPSELYRHRPLFGPFRHATSIRGFWGVTWHQNLRSTMEGTSTFVAEKVLALPPASPLQRYFKFVWSFTLSGIYHMLINMGNGIQFPHMPTLLSFMLQIVGITIEGLTMAQLRRTRWYKNSYCCSIAGYAWTFCFLGWSMVPWLDAVTAHTTYADSILGFQMLGSIFSRR